MASGCGLCGLALKLRAEDSAVMGYVKNKKEEKNKLEDGTRLCAVGQANSDIRSRRNPEGFKKDKRLARATMDEGVGAPGLLKKLRRRRATGRKGASWTAPQRGHERIKRLVHATAMHSHIWQHSVKKEGTDKKKLCFFCV